MIREWKYCKIHGHDWETISTMGASLAVVKCKRCGAVEYRL